MYKWTVTGVVLLASVFAAPAAITTYVISMDGAQEIPGPGDPDGFGTAVLEIDDSASPPTITWNFTVEGIVLPLTGAHIHVGAAGTSGPVRVDFAAQLSGGPLADPDLVDVLANPTNYYVNLHNSVYPGGAIRGQIPEPTTLALLALGGLALMRRR